MSHALLALARRLGNPIAGVPVMTDPALSELLAHVDDLTDLTERCANATRTLGKPGAARANC